MTTDHASPILTSQVLSHEEFDASIVLGEGRTMLTGREEAPWRQDSP